MREIVGFVMGAAAGAAGALFVSSPEGKALIQRLREEARPDVERATTEWEPVLNEVARAVRLAAREVETATADLRSRLADLAAAPPADDEPAAIEPAAIEPATVEAGPAGAIADDALPARETAPGPSTSATAAAVVAEDGEPAIPAAAAGDEPSLGA